MATALTHQAIDLNRTAVSVRDFIPRIWPHASSRKGAVAMILVACAIETAGVPRCSRQWATSPAPRM